MSIPEVNNVVMEMEEHRVECIFVHVSKMQAPIDKCGKNPDAIKWVFCGMADVFVANKLTTEMKSLRGIQGRLAGSRGKGIADFMVMRLNLRDYIVNKIPWRVRG